MKTFREFLEESHGVAMMPWQSNPEIGWWKDQHPDHYVMYHGTHDSNVPSMLEHGIKAPTTGSTAGWVSLTHDPHTAHGYASMGGEQNYVKAGAPKSFRAAGKGSRRPPTVPHEQRSVLVLHIPKDWAHENMEQHFRGNVDSTRDRLLNKDNYDAHKAAGKQDQEYYAATELRFKDRVPPEFIKGVTKKVV